MPVPTAALDRSFQNWTFTHPTRNGIKLSDCKNQIVKSKSNQIKRRLFDYDLNLTCVCLVYFYGKTRIIWWIIRSNFANATINLEFSDYETAKFKLTHILSLRLHQLSKREMLLDLERKPKENNKTKISKSHNFILFSFKSNQNQIQTKNLSLMPPLYPTKISGQQFHRSSRGYVACWLLVFLPASVLKYRIYFTNCEPGLPRYSD